MTTSNGTGNQAATAPAGDAARAEALVAKLEDPRGDVFEAFEALDALPADVVRAVLAAKTGPARAPEALDSEIRLAHGFPAPPLELECTRAVRPSRVERLSANEREQIQHAGKTWDGLDLPAEARLARDGGEASFAGALEHLTIDEVDGTPQFEVVLLHGDSGVVFHAGTTDVVGTVAYGKVEVKARRVRDALTRALAQPRDDAPESLSGSPPSEPEPPTRKADALEPEPPTRRAPPPSDPDPSLQRLSGQTAPSEPPSTKAAPKRATSSRKVAAKRAAEPGEPTEKKSAKKGAAKASAEKKTSAKKTAAAKTSAKKTAAAKTSAKAPSEKKAASAKKPAATKKKRAST